MLSGLDIIKPGRDTASRMFILDERRKPRQGTATCRAAPRRAARTRGGGPTARRQPATMNVGALETRRRLRRPGTSSVGWAGSSDPKDGTGAAGQGGLGALRASSSDGEASTDSRPFTAPVWCFAAPIPALRVSRPPEVPMLRPQPHVLVLATSGVAAPIHSNRDAPHSPATDLRPYRVHVKILQIAPAVHGAKMPTTGGT